MSYQIYPWNPFGNNPDAKIKNEAVTVSGENRDVFVPRYAPFFAKGFKLKDAKSGVPLIVGKDYVFGNPFGDFIDKKSKVVYGSVVLLPSAIDRQLVIEEYDTIGGPFTQDDARFLELIASVSHFPRTVDWSQVVDLPMEGFPEDPHEHKPDLTYNYEKLIDVLTQLDEAMRDEFNNPTVASELTEHVNQSIKLAHPDLSAADFNLERVPNYRPAKDADLAGASDQLLMTVDKSRKLIIQLLKDLDLFPDLTPTDPEQPLPPSVEYLTLEQAMGYFYAKAGLLGEILEAGVLAQSTARSNLGLKSGAIADVVQSKGTSANNVMSQKVVSEELNSRPLKSLKINGHDLSKDITLTPGDINAEPAGTTVESVLPLPDVWIPFNDSLEMICGHGTDVMCIENDTFKIPGLNLVEFTRNSTATYIDKSGLLRKAKINEPRFELQGLLIEGFSTNLTPRSENWDNHDHTKGGASTNVVLEENPYGELSQIKSIVSNLPNVNVSLVGNPPDMSEVKSLSVFFNIKTIESGFFIYISSISDKVVFDNSGEIVSVAEGITAKVTKVGGAGWRRLTMSTTTAVTRFSVNLEYVGDEIAFWGVQTESLPFASSYIPTNGAAATRAAEMCSIPRLPNMGSALPGEMTVAISFNKTGFSREFSNYLISLVDVTNNDRYGILTVTNPGNDYSFDGYGNGFGGEATKVNDDPIVMCLGLTGTRGFAVNGKYTQSTDGNPSPRKVPDGVIRFGVRTTEGTRAWGHFRDFRIWRKELTPNQIKVIK